MDVIQTSSSNPTRKEIIEGIHGSEQVKSLGYFLRPFNSINALPDEVLDATSIANYMKVEKSGWKTFLQYLSFQLEPMTYKLSHIEIKWSRFV